METFTPKKFKALTKEEYIEEFEKIKDRFLPRTRRQAKNIGYVKFSPDMYALDCVDASKINALFFASTLGKYISHITMRSRVEPEFSIKNMSMCDLQKIYLPICEAMEVAFGFNDKTFATFLPLEFDPDYDCNANPDKYTVKDFAAGKTMYGVSGKEESGKTMQLWLTADRKFNCIDYTIAVFNTKG